MRVDSVARAGFASAGMLFCVGAGLAQESVCYEYDELGRLTSATYLDGSQISYSYDSQGNRTQLAHDTNGVASCSTPSVPAEFPGQIAQNQPPTAQNDSASVQVSSAIEIAVLANDSDPDGNNLTITSVTQPSQGSASITSGNTKVTFTAPSSAGSYNFSYTVSDGNGGSASATVTATVTAPTNNPPTANYDGATVSRFNSVTIYALANDTDPDGDALTITSVTQPAEGAAVLVNNNTAVRFDAGWTSDVHVLTYTISDGNGGTSSNSIAVSVTGGGGLEL